MERILMNRIWKFSSLSFPSQPSLSRNVMPFSVSSVQCLDRPVLEPNPNALRILTEKQDYSFLDGRPVPLGSGVKRRVMKQREYAETIVRLSKEIDFAVERHNTLLEEEEDARQKKLDSKLKPKGHRLLKSK